MRDEEKGMVCQRIGGSGAVQQHCMFLWGCGGGYHDSIVVKVPHRIRLLKTNQQSFYSIFPVFLCLTQIHQQ